MGDLGKNTEPKSPLGLDNQAKGEVIKNHKEETWES